MNCDDLEDAMIDIARDAAGGDPLAAQAAAHAESCPRCAGRLAAERNLAAIFRNAAADDSSRAPDQIEETLLAAFRKRHLQSAGSAPAGLSRGLWALAAALLLALLAGTVYQVFYAPQGPGAAAGNAVSPAPEAQDPAAAEIATEFMPLTSESGIAMMESGMVVRVTLPRSALATVGLPVNPELADRPVTAQVLIGQDGVARAIRFLNDSKGGFVKTNMQSKQ